MVERHVNSDGYSTVKDTEGIYGKKNSWIPEHRLVMAKFIGAPLPSEAHVHHINGNKSDNRIENLAIVNNAGHKAIHVLNPVKVIVKRECYDREFVGKQRWLKLCCPMCGYEFFKPVSQSHLKLSKKHNVDCCSQKCSTLFNELIERDGITYEIQNKIDSNIICEFKASGKYMERYIKNPPRDKYINDSGLLVYL